MSWLVYENAVYSTCWISHLVVDTVAEVEMMMIFLIIFIVMVSTVADVVNIVTDFIHAFDNLEQRRRC